MRECSHRNNTHFLNDNDDMKYRCLDCGFVSKSRTEVFSRVVGYYRPTSGWNPGKKAEWDVRGDFDLGTAFKLEAPAESTDYSTD